MAVWKSTNGSSIPKDAIRAGYEKDGTPLFIARADMNGIMTPGKCSVELNGAHIPFDGKEEIVPYYDVLVLPFTSNGFLDWQKASNGYVPCNAYETAGGIYIGRAFHHGSLVPGKINVDHSCAYITYGGEEFRVETYEVLTKEK
ncbi:uncharacterized protein LOC134243598 [Saccostrea cucullata]|uniref:uncharacterized protein LOC134243598 n=1 Tax=Saccostrea cuccullata TaxID=36930 RepID=UPI002ED3ADE0